MAKRDYTPDECIKVIGQVIATQRERGYKAGWVRHEMEHRADEAERRGGSFYLCGTSPRDLSFKAYYIATGEHTIDDVRESLESYWEMMKEAM